jgi:hypothetical protein
VKADTSEFGRETFPQWAHIHSEVPSRGDLPPVQVHWYNGGGNSKELWQDMGVLRRLEGHLGKPLDWTSDDGDGWDDWAGILLVGTEGKLYANAHNTTFTLLPEEKFRDFNRQKHSLPRSRGHEMEWLVACKGGDPAMSNFDYAGPLAEFVLLGNVAAQYPEKLEFHPREMKITNHAAADRALSRDYREGWVL